MLPLVLMIRPQREHSQNCPLTLSPVMMRRGTGRGREGPASFPTLCPSSPGSQLVTNRETSHQQDGREAQRPSCSICRSILEQPCAGSKEIPGDS